MILAISAGMRQALLIVFPCLLLWLPHQAHLRRITPASVTPLQVALVEPVAYPSAQLLTGRLGSFRTRRELFLKGSDSYCSWCSSLWRRPVSFAPADILKAWEAVNVPLSKESKKHFATLNQQVLIEIAVDRVGQAARLKDLQIPWLLICETNDWRFEEMKRFASNQDRSEFVPLEGLDHLQTWIRFELVLPSVQGFLRLRG
ncbi:MAG: hypothetical protein HYZ50_00915 [Deltaproteobacteria bacterium]|nr:hypothetical protein [Deltaproteobacteria bacterium]